MMLPRHLAFLWALSCGLALALPSLRSPKDLPRRQEAPFEDRSICGRIIDEVNKGFIFFYAADVYDCLVSVPFHQAPALRFIEYYNTTIQFQSTLAHLKNPPAGYQQPAFDFMKALDELRHNVTTGVFKNQYDFEAMMQYLVYSVHDAHVDLYAGILSAFSFASPMPLVAASIDGKEAPKVYFADDIIARRDNITHGIESTISAVSHINGEPVIEYLTRFGALQSVGMLEPHADWNELMDHPVQDIQGIFSIFSGSSTFYPGDSLTFSFEDPSVPKLETSWVAIYNNAEFTGPLETPGDFYNFFVLGLLPASYYDVPLPEAFGGVSNAESPLATGNPPAAGDVPVDSAAEQETSGWYESSFGAFPPNPDIQQEDLGLYKGGILTGYFYDGISTGVISIPHFNQYASQIGTFSQALAGFTAGAKDRGVSRIVIDLQKNYGGSTGIALLLFREFFPGIDPFTGSQRRSHELGNSLGSAITEYWQGLEAGTRDSLLLLADEWMIATRLNAETRRNFTSWEEYEGPRRQSEDDFSLVEQYDLKNQRFHESAFDGWLLNRYLNDSKEDSRTMWRPEDVVILTDGTCSSACALFLELAKTQGGARTVVVGGAPKPGPMQAASGSRGASLYTSDAIDRKMDWIGERNPAVRPRFPLNRNERGIFIEYAAFNLRDQLRADDTSTPLQFRYAAADCRLYYTIDNVYNMTALWHDVARAAFENPSMCVEGSTEYAMQSDGGSAPPPPKPSAVPAPAPQPAVTFTVDYDPSIDNGLPADSPKASRYNRPQSTWGHCPENRICPGGYSCKPITWFCTSSGRHDEWACAPPCIPENSKNCASYGNYNAIENNNQISSRTKRALPASGNRARGFRSKGSPDTLRSDSIRGKPVKNLNHRLEKKYIRPEENHPGLCDV
ncbi:peptidase S41 family protein [Colletotrichum eremochloae]|nr:peptidase S41 family protein [Colletotrichum eremochloae]